MPMHFTFFYEVQLTNLYVVFRPFTSQVCTINLFTNLLSQATSLQ